MMPQPLFPKSCWILTDGSMGMINQCLGIAESMGLKPLEKIVRLGAPWRWLTPHLYVGSNDQTFYALDQACDPLAPPFPDLVFSCGRQAIAPALWIQQASKGLTKIVHIQNPKINPRHFDAVVVPQHDKITGPNVIQTIGSPHKVSAEKLFMAKADFPDLAPHCPDEKIIGILLGGPSKAYRMDESYLIDQLLPLLNHWQQAGYRILLSPSRRTPQPLIDRLLAKASPQLFVWDCKTPNPYFAILGYADALFVTCDSVCMVTEACITDKPVYLLPLPGRGSRRFDAFHQALIHQGRVQWGPRTLEEALPFSLALQTPLNENVDIANQLINLLYT